MQTVTSPDGTMITYEQIGTGPHLVLVHGMAGDHQRWHHVASRLAQHFTVSAMDRRGRGESGDASDCALDGQADDIASVVAGLDGPTQGSKTPET